MTSPQQQNSPLSNRSPRHSVSSPNLQSILEQRQKQEQRIALSKQESLLLSSAGDVISCRCRDSNYPQQSEEILRTNGCYQWQDNGMMCCDAECDELTAQMKANGWQKDIGVMCCDAEGDDLTVQMQEETICGVTTRGGLLGGAPAQVASPLNDGLRGGGPFHADQHGTRREGTISSRAQQAFRSPPLSPGRGYDEDSIVPIRSFDYSHFAEGGNDMLPEKSSSPKTPSTQRQTSPERKEEVEVHNTIRQAPFPQFVHGIPTFLKSFSQVKIAHVSAHALGSHVLLISDAGLLYSYGLNDHGQLGVGIKTPATGSHRGYIMEPTIVTPLVENGGKAIACAAGVSHSLVVIATEERRIAKAYSYDQVTPIARQRSGSSSASSSVVSTDSFFHHQMYGFGRNDFNKIGLVSPKIAKAGSPDEMESAVLPRRVALRCKVRLESSWPDDIMPPQGIFAIAASAEHSAALVRRASGDVELYTWGNAMHGALGLPEPIAGTLGLSIKRKGATHPSVKVVPVPSFVSSLSRTTNPAAQPRSLLLNEEGEYPLAISLGRRCSFVVTSLGRCFSFGESDEGMLGLGQGVTEQRQPSELYLPIESRGESLVAVSAGASHAVANASSGKVFAWGSRLAAGVGPANGVTNGNGAKEHLGVAWTPVQVRLPNDPRSKENSMRIVQTCAGYDNTVFVADSGRVLSCGKNSGRLGLGELDKDVERPRTLFGGLHLWQRRPQDEAKKTKITKPKPAKPRLKRGVTLA